MQTVKHTVDIQEPEMVFLVINLTKTRDFCSMLLIVLFTGGFLKKTILFSGFKNPFKKIRETRKLESIYG